MSKKISRFENSFRQRKLSVDFPICTYQPRSVVLYGDESTSEELVTYCLLCVPSQTNIRLQQQMSEIYRTFGGKKESRLHCRELFSGERRSRTDWKHLNEQETWDFVKEVASLIPANFSSCGLGVAHIKTYPRFMPDGKGGTFEVKPETGYSLAFQSAVMSLSAAKLIEQNTRYALFIDQQNTSFNFFGLKSAKLVDMVKAAGLQLTDIDFEPLPLDLADLVAYSAARALSTHPYRNKIVCEEVIRICNPTRTDFWWPIRDEDTLEAPFPFAPKIQASQ